MTLLEDAVALRGQLDVRAICSDFPILDRHINGHPLVYLDSAATSQKPRSVLAAMQRYYEVSNANVHRGVYLLAEEATEQYEAARATVAGFVHARTSEEIIFTRNATEAINLVAYTWGRQHIESGDQIVLSPAEHHSNFVPWQALASERGATLELVQLTDDGIIDLDSLDRLLGSGRVKLVAVAGVSNVLGTINPIEEIVKRAHKTGALVLVDAAQMAPHMSLDVSVLGADFVAITGHKMLGPMGIGALWARAEILDAMPPFLYGGEMIRRVTAEKTTWNDLPWKFEAGTPNVEGAVGLMAAIEYLEDLGMENVREHEKAIVTYALERLGAIEDLTILGSKHAELRGGVIAFVLNDVHPHDLAYIVDRECGVAIRAGHHCAQPLHDRLGLGASARASFYVYNRPEDVDSLCQGIEIARRVMGGRSSVPSTL